MDWTEQTAEYKKEERIANILASMRLPQFQPDMSLSTELRGLLAFTSRTSKDRIISGPEDLAVAEQLLNEINQYRDRAVEIHLACIAQKAEIDLCYSMIRRILLLKPEVQSKTVAIQTAIVGVVADEVESLQSRWDTLLQQSEFLFKNCRLAFDNIHLQVDVAKQMWFQRQGNIEGAVTGSGTRRLASELNQR